MSRVLFVDPGVDEVATVNVAEVSSMEKGISLKRISNYPDVLFTQC